MTQNTKNILSRFPKKIPKLPPEYESIYKEEYKRGRTPSGIFLKAVHFVESWMHRKISKYAGLNTLEIGAGTLGHLCYEKGWKEYDIVEPMPFLYEGTHEASLITDRYNRISEIPKDNQYDKVLSIAVFEHMSNLPLEIALLSGITTKDTRFFIAIPNEGGFLWWLSWRCTTGLSFWLRHRLNYQIMMKHEHVNTAPEIIAVCEYLFEDISLSRFPFMGHHTSLFTVIEAKGLKTDLCQSLLKEDDETRQ